MKEDEDGLVSARGETGRPSEKLFTTNNGHFQNQLKARQRDQGTRSQIQGVSWSPRGAEGSAGQTHMEELVVVTFAVILENVWRTKRTQTKEPKKGRVKRLRRPLSRLPSSHDVSFFRLGTKRLYQLWEKAPGPCPECPTVSRSQNRTGTSAAKRPISRGSAPWGRTRHRRDHVPPRSRQAANKDTIRERTRERERKVRDKDRTKGQKDEITGARHRNSNKNRSQKGGSRKGS